MRKPICLALLAVYLSLPGCVTTGAGGPVASSLGPEKIESVTHASTLPARITAGLTWLWSSYSALKAKGVDVSPLRDAIGELQDVAQRGDLTAALSLYGKARAIVTVLVGVAL